MDLLLTLIIFFALICCVLYKVKVYSDFNPDFFSIQNTTALRGIWSFIVIMVHIPLEYGNILQDMAGSFAYVGVTFFFMLSGFGLSLNLMRSGTIQKGFWQKRLLKLFVPQLLLNIVSAISMYAVFGDKITISSFLLVTRWLWWLLVCYLIFWTAHKLLTNKKWSNVAISVSIVVFSVVLYWLKHLGIVTTTIWSSEIYGFLWGIALALQLSHIQNVGKTHWFRKAALACIAALLLGMLYLKFKPIIFWGDYLLRILLGIVIIGFVLILNMRISIGNKALNQLGKISYELYLSHAIVINFLTRIIPDLSSGMFIMLVLVISIILSAFIHAISALILKKIAFNK